MENLNEQVSRIKLMMKMVNEGEYTNENLGMLARIAAPMAASYIGSKMADANEEDLNELGGYIGDAPEKISGPKIAKIDPRIHEGYSGYDVLRAQKLLLNIYAYGDIEIPTEDYLKLSNYMKEIYESVKYDENQMKQQQELDKEDMSF